jgi:hypothetical protein
VERKAYDLAKFSAIRDMVQLMVSLDLYKGGDN